MSSKIAWLGRDNIFISLVFLFTGSIHSEIAFLSEKDLCSSEKIVVSKHAKWNFSDY